MKWASTSQKMSEYIPAQQRREVAARAAGRCEYCGVQEKFSGDPFTVDHIIPVAGGGATTSTNLAFACFGCNQHRSTQVRAAGPITGQDANLFHPRLQIWSEHFTWNGDRQSLAFDARTMTASILALCHER
ncbi:MAG TPA: HNH endonuclease signature motif containing protein [Blastocatellia bacterium]